MEVRDNLRGGFLSLSESQGWSSGALCLPGLCFTLNGCVQGGGCCRMVVKEEDNLRCRYFPIFPASEQAADSVDRIAGWYLFRLYGTFPVNFKIQ